MPKIPEEILGIGKEVATATTMARIGPVPPLVTEMVTGPQSGQIPDREITIPHGEVLTQAKEISTPSLVTIKALIEAATPQGVTLATEMAILARTTQAVVVTTKILTIDLGLIARVVIKTIRVTEIIPETSMEVTTIVVTKTTKVVVTRTKAILPVEGILAETGPKRPKEYNSKRKGFPGGTLT